ncbi:hypothetical protein GCM10027446_07130 [Angustibacter peucedani]
MRVASPATTACGSATTSGTGARRPVSTSTRYLAGRALDAAVRDRPGVGRRRPDMGRARRAVGATVSPLGARSIGVVY